MRAGAPAAPSIKDTSYTVGYKPDEGVHMAGVTQKLIAPGGEKIEREAEFGRQRLPPKKVDWNRDPLGALERNPLAPNMPLGDELFLLDRDPNEINNHVKVEFHDVFGERIGALSPESIFRLSYRCFICTKNCWYTCLACILGVPLSLCWGIIFATASFLHIWSITPCFRLADGFLSSCGICYRSYCMCQLAPIWEAIGMLFSNVRVRIQNASHL